MRMILAVPLALVGMVIAGIGMMFLMLAAVFAAVANWVAGP
jgi:hypothetical protein